MPLAACRGTIARIRRGAPRSSRASTVTPSETAVRSTVGCTVGGPGSTGGPAGGGDEHVAVNASATPGSTVALIRNMRSPPRAESIVTQLAEFNRATFADQKTTLNELF